jgi:hypothetical protein
MHYSSTSIPRTISLESLEALSHAGDGGLIGVFGAGVLQNGAAGHEHVGACVCVCVRVCVCECVCVSVCVCVCV